MKQLYQTHTFPVEDVPTLLAVVQISPGQAHCQRGRKVNEEDVIKSGKRSRVGSTHAHDQLPQEAGWVEVQTPLVAVRLSHS